MSRARRKKEEMNSLGVVLSPEVLAGAERRGGKGGRSAVRRQPKRVPARDWPRVLVPRLLRKQSGASSPPNINFAFCRKPRPPLANAAVSECCCAGKACTHHYWPPGGVSGPAASS